jgi:hypothetical protein
MGPSRFHVVGQDVQGHFDADVLGRSHLEVGGSHPGFYRTEGALHGPAAFAHLIRGFDRGALAPPQGRLRAPSVRSVALCRLCTGPLARSLASVGPVTPQRLTILFVGVVIGSAASNRVSFDGLRPFSAGFEGPNKTRAAL